MVEGVGAGTQAEDGNGGSSSADTTELVAGIGGGSQPALSTKQQVAEYLADLYPTEAGNAHRMRNRVRTFEPRKYVKKRITINIVSIQSTL